MKTYAAQFEELQRHVGTLMRHTSKAVKRGLPANRVFAVVEVDDGQPKGPHAQIEQRVRPYLVAWKHELRPDGRIQHAGILGTRGVMRPDDARLFCKKTRTGSEPTATFTLDSFYEPWKRGP